jgi:hypothetical protein
LDCETALQQVAVFNAMRKSVSENAAGAQKQMRVFWWTILILFLWQFLPEASTIIQCVTGV